MGNLVKTFDNGDWVVDIYFAADGSGDAPDGATDTWDSNADTVAVATGFKVEPKSEVNVRHGAGSREPVSVNEGNHSYSWSIDAFFTSDTVGPAAGKKTLEHLAVIGKFAMRLTLADSTDIVRIMTGCKCSSSPLTGSDGNGVTVSAEGVAATYTSEA